MSNDKSRPSDLQIFRPNLPPVVPLLTTTEVKSIVPNLAKSGGNITNDGGESILALGVFWSTSQNPTINNDKTTNFHLPTNLRVQ